MYLGCGAASAQARYRLDARLSQYIAGSAHDQVHAPYLHSSLVTVRFHQVARVYSTLLPPPPLPANYTPTISESEYVTTQIFDRKLVEN